MGATTYAGATSIRNAKRIKSDAKRIKSDAKRIKSDAKRIKSDQEVFHSPTIILCPLATGLTGTLTYVKSICLQQYMLGSIPSKSNT